MAGQPPNRPPGWSPGRPPGMVVLPGGQGAGGATANRLASKYDEAEFLVGGRGGGKGEMESVTFKIHEGYVAELDKWWRAKLFPYKTISDILRHAVVRHVRYFLPSMEGEVEGSLIHELVQIDEIVTRWKFHNMFVKHIEAIAEQVNVTLTMPNGKSEVERMLRGIKRRIDSTRPSFHKAVYEKMFNDRFGAYLSRIVLLEGGGDEHSAMADVADLPEFGGGDPSLGLYDVDDDGDEDDDGGGGDGDGA